MGTPWFAAWFDSPYYPILYQHRDDSEAERFLSRLLKRLQLPAGSEVLDLACGRGRHARYLHAQGLNVTGLDLSPASIADANLFAAPGLQFGVHDMRDPLPAPYDVILNLFTSLGYFEDTRENQQVIHHIAQALRPQGTFVIDFMNTEKILRHLVPQDHKEIQGIHFHITKTLEQGIIVKRIHIEDGDQTFDYAERVQALTETDIVNMIQNAGLEVFERWGSYEATPFSATDSDRLILFARHQSSRSSFFHR